eukprot:8234757-Pyramimonas_sp.AAC.1
MDFVTSGGPHSQNPIQQKIKAHSRWISGAGREIASVPRASAVSNSDVGSGGTTWLMHPSSPVGCLHGADGMVMRSFHKGGRHESCRSDDRLDFDVNMEFVMLSMMEYTGHPTRARW